MPQIVDIKGLADILFCSKSMLLKTWKQLPHFYIGLGATAKSARFDVADVVAYYKQRDYAVSRQKNEVMDRDNPKGRATKKEKKKVPDQNGSKGMGKKNIIRITKPSTDPFNLLSGIN